MDVDAERVFVSRSASVGGCTTMVRMALHRSVAASALSTKCRSTHATRKLFSEARTTLATSTAIWVFPTLLNGSLVLA
jgi:hypothetical protein